MVLKNSTRNQLHALDFTLSLIGVFWCIAIALWFGYGPLAFWIAFLLPLVLSLPTFWVHCEYLLIPHTKKIETNYESQKMTLTTKAGEEVISFDQVSSVDVYACPNKYSGSIRAFAFEEYHFAIIKLTDYRQIIITCFMAEPIFKAVRQFDTSPINYRRLFFPSILLKNLSWK